MVSSSTEARIVQTASSLHRAYRGLSKAEAESQFIREASSPDTSPLTHNSHLYRLKQRKQDPGLGTVLLAIYTRGIELYQVPTTPRSEGKTRDLASSCVYVIRQISREILPPSLTTKSLEVGDSCELHQNVDNLVLEY